MKSIAFSSAPEAPWLYSGVTNTEFALRNSRIQSAAPRQACAQFGRPTYQHPRHLRLGPCTSNDDQFYAIAFPRTSFKRQCGRSFEGGSKEALDPGCSFLLWARTIGSVKRIPSMKSGELKLLELLKADEESGVIRFKHRRMLIFDADAIGLLRQELVETLGLERARHILTRLRYACGYRDALRSKELFDWQSDDDWWAAGPRLHQLEGIVQVRMLRSHMDRRLGVLEAEAEWLHSYEAEQHLKNIGPSEL